MSSTVFSPERWCTVTWWTCVVPMATRGRNAGRCHGDKIKMPTSKWVFPKIGVGPPNHPILIGFGTIINHPFWGPTPILGNTQIFNDIFFYKHDLLLNFFFYFLNMSPLISMFGTNPAFQVFLNNHAETGTIAAYRSSVRMPARYCSFYTLTQLESQFIKHVQPEWMKHHGTFITIIRFSLGNPIWKINTSFLVT